jgi:hypothetical protein
MILLYLDKFFLKLSLFHEKLINIFFFFLLLFIYYKKTNNFKSNIRN